MSLFNPLVSVISQCRWEGVVLMGNGSFSLLHVISPESQDCQRMQLSEVSGDIGRQHNFFILAQLDGIFFCPSPNIHIWIIRGWMSFRKWKLNSESQRKSESGRRVLREREQRQNRQREKKGKVKKRQRNRRKHRRPQKGISKNGNAILHGLLILRDPRDRGECMGRLPAKKLFCDMRFHWGSISKWNYSTWSFFITYWPKAGHIHFWKARINSKNWKMMKPKYILSRSPFKSPRLS